MYRLVPVVVLVGLVLGIVLWVVGASVGVLVLGTIALVSLTVAGAAAVPRWERALYRRRLRERERAHRDLLDRKRSDVAELIMHRQRSLAEQDPDPIACLRRATGAPDTLWQRDVARDGLRVRIGVRDVPTALDVHAPTQLDANAPDPLVDAAASLADTARTTEEPIDLSIAEDTPVIGPRDRGLDVARALLAQLATHYAPEQLELLVMCAEDERPAWRWTRWLPHVAHAPAVGSASDARTTVALVTNPTLASAVPPNAHRVVLVERADREYDVTLELAARGSARLLAGADLPVQHIDHVDAVKVDLAEQVARALAGRGRHPARAPSLFELLGPDAADPRRIARRWTARAGQPLAPPIGLDANDEVVILPLADHVLVRGGTPEQRARLLETIAISLSAQRTPRDLRLMLAGLSAALLDVPHVIGTASLAALGDQVRASRPSVLVVASDDPKTDLAVARALDEATALGTRVVLGTAAADLAVPHVDLLDSGQACLGGTRFTPVSVEVGPTSIVEVTSDGARRVLDTGTEPPLRAWIDGVRRAVEMSS